MTAGLFLGALALVLVGIVRPRAPAMAAASPLTLGRTTTALIAGTSAALVALFLTQLHVIAVAAATQSPFPASYAALPVTPIDESPPLYGHTPDWVANSLLGLTIVETAALYALYRMLRGRRLTRTASASLLIAAAVMLVAALRTTATTSQDLYLYVGFAHLGTAAYAPPRTPFEDGFAVVNKLWGLPMLPAAYGPLWIAVSRLSLFAGGSLGAQVEALRALGALAFCASAAFVVALRRDAAIVALFVLNPALLEQYVADGHNDIFCLALTLGAFVAARRSFPLAILLVAAAGAAKLPFALLGSLAFVPIESTRRRLIATAAAVLLALVATQAGSGGRYIPAAAQVLARYPFGDSFATQTRLAVFLLALVALGVAVAARRLNRGASWSFLAFGTEVFPWYVAWGIPYALLENTWLWVYLISAPLVAFNLTTVYAPTAWTRAAYGLLLLAPLVPLLHDRTVTREARNAPRRTSGL